MVVMYASVYCRQLLIDTSLVVDAYLVTEDEVRYSESAETLAKEEAIHQSMVVETIVQDADLHVHQVLVEEMVETTHENCPRMARDHREMQNATNDTDDVVRYWQIAIRPSVRSLKLCQFESYSKYNS